MSKVDNRHAKKIIEKIQKNPIFFCEKILGIKPWEKQKEVLEKLAKYRQVAVRSGHATGKSFIASAAALWFLYAFYPSKVITTAPTHAQVKMILWKEIKKLHRHAKIQLGGEVLEKQIKIDEQHFAIGIATDQAERMQGFHSKNILVILDEAVGVKEEIWLAAETLLTGENGKILVIGNPTKANGKFYECFKINSSWQKIQISCLDSPNIKNNDNKIKYPQLVTKAWIKNKEQEWGKESELWRTRILGEFPEDDEEKLIPIKWIEKCLVKNLPPSKSKNIYLGVDVARYGKDKTAFVIRSDDMIIDVKLKSQYSTMKTVGKVIKIKEKWKIKSENIFIDDTGIGAGVTDRLKEMGYNVTPVVMAEKAENTKYYANTKTEIYWKLRKKIEENYLNNSKFYMQENQKELIEQLNATSYEINSNGAVKVVSKKNIKKNLKQISPDLADALALTFAKKQKKELNEEVITII